MNRFLIPLLIFLSFNGFAQSVIVPIKFLNEVSSDDTAKITAVVAEDIKDANGVRFISVNSPVRVSSIKSKSDNTGKGGNISIKFEWTTGIGNTPIKLAGTYTATGKNNKGAWAAKLVTVNDKHPTANGHSAIIPAGTIIKEVNGVKVNNLDFLKGVWQAEPTNNKYQMAVSWDSLNCQFKGVLTVQGNLSQQVGFSIGEECWRTVPTESNTLIGQQKWRSTAGTFFWKAETVFLEKSNEEIMITSTNTFHKIGSKSKKTEITNSGKSKSANLSDVQSTSSNSSGNTNKSSELPLSSSTSELKVPKTDVEKDGLKGKVKQVKVNGKYVTKYDERGNKTESNYCVPGGIDEDEDVVATFTYDDKGNMIEKSETYVSSKTVTKMKYKYDMQRNMIEEKNADPKDVYRTDYKYDERRNMIEKTFFITNVGKTESKRTYKYDSHDNMIEEKEFTDFSHGKGGKGLELTSTDINKYDNQGNKMETNHTTSFKQFNTKFTYKYDSKGNQLEMNLYNSSGKLTSKTTTVYEYDTNGNWLKKKETGGVITTRTIEYYP